MREAAATSSDKGSFYIPSLDGLRAIAWAIVFFSHVGGRRFVPGGFGVTIFFFLSGFLITTLMRVELEQTGRVHLKQFYLRRVLRILPPMYTALSLAFVLSLIVGWPVTGNALLAQGFHFTNYHLALGGTGRALGTDALWSLSVEEHFYLLFPIVFIALSRSIREPKHQAIVLLLIAAALLAWRIVLVKVFHATPLYTQHTTDARMDSILFGCVLALYRNPALPGPQLPAKVVWVGFVIGFVTLVATIAVRGNFVRETFRYSVQGLALAPVFIAAIRFPDSLSFRWLNSRLMKWIGVLSYSLYLVHLPIILTLATYVHSEKIVTVLAFFLSIGVAAAIYYTIERPCARLRRRLSKIQ